MGAGGKQNTAPAAGPKVLEKAWKIHGKLYDLNEFANIHPGGNRAIMNAACHPEGELFVESYHPNADTVYSMIEKYEVKGDVTLEEPIKEAFEAKLDYTFEADGWYRKLKKDAMAKLRGQGAQKFKNTKKLKKTNLRGDDIYLAVDVLHLVLLTMMTLMLWAGSWKAAVAVGVLRGAVIMRIAHVASHASLSPYPEINMIMYYASMMFAGTAPEIWSRKHVVRHHVNTNEPVLDEDRMEPIKCIFKAAQWLDYHKNQHIYVWPFYVHVVMAWSFSDLLSNATRAGAGCVEYTWKEKALNIGTLLSHMAITYAAPLYFAGWWGLVLVEINTLLTSVIFGFEFIVNHEIIGCDIFEESKDKKVDWGLYQAISSADFHPLGWGSWFFNQLTGGLNLQICHHLFPGIHYRHYPELTKIIYEHMEKVGQKPVYSDNVVTAVVNHYEFLKDCSAKYAPEESKKVQ
eukprot:TRINITY_DN20752_c0_g1_i1.p1 TRINITY_DN20752_c0_g1~~TRINITY_DN20752_c0_g1_i1.p1  ORF type:complete len:459 (+),score=245.52 TRINITY_DN20752_c0_g1_i1:57-1433(+)